MKNLFTRSVDLFFLTRPILLIPVWGFAAFGYFCGHNGNIRGMIPFWASTPLSVYLMILIFSISVGAVYIVNQLADIEVDKKNGGLPLLASGIVSVRSGKIAAIAVSFLSIIIPLLFSEKTLSILALISIIIGILYSFKPSFFSGRPFFDFLTNAFGYGVIAFGAGWHLSGQTIVTLKFVYASFPYFLLMCAGSISSTIPDFEGDKDCGKRTTAVFLDKKKAHLLATLLLLTGLSVSIINKDFVAFLCAIAPLPLYVLYIFSQKQIFMESTYKIGGGICVVAAMYSMPLFFFAALIVFLSTWLYFRIRHGVYYPSLLPARHD
jgi:4-hydroxybenzoate polyprenyltransferase